MTTTEQLHEDDGEFVRADFAHWAASYQQNEELGDKRLNFFVLTVAGVFGALGFLAKDGKDVFPSATIQEVTAFASAMLLGLGILTLMRLERRARVTASYLKVLWKLRSELAPRWAKDASSLILKDSPRWKRGGLVYMAAVMNGGLAGILAWSIAAIAHATPSVAIGGGVFALATVLQFVLLWVWDDDRKRTPAPEAAGGTAT